MTTASIPKVCALCGTRHATTREHVPAKSLFANLPPDLITVPACSECNNGSSLDDEYLKNTFGLVREDNPSPALDALRPSISRALNRPDKPGQQRNYLKSVEFNWRAGAGGSVVTLQAVMTPDPERLRSTVAKHMRGLFYFVTGQILPPGWHIQALSDRELDSLDQAAKAAAGRLVDIAVNRGVRGGAGSGEVFRFAIAGVGPSSNHFVCVTSYFMNFGYLGVSVSPEDMAARAAGIVVI